MADEADTPRTGQGRLASFSQPPSDDPWVLAAEEAVLRFEAANPLMPGPVDPALVRREVPVDVFDDAARDQVRAIGYLAHGAVAAPHYAALQTISPPAPTTPQASVRYAAPPYRLESARPLHAESIAYSARMLGGR